MLYGSKDIMRMEDLYANAYGDWHKGMLLAKQMADSVTNAGKAQARGYAAQEIFGQLSPVAYIFFERAHHLGGEDVKPEASLNPIDNVDAAFEGIAQERLPASRLNLEIETPQDADDLNTIYLEPMSRINLVNGEGPEFNIHDTPSGMMEVWIDSNTVKPKIIWTASNEPNNPIGQKRNIDINGKETTWEMMDYIDAIYMANLVPLYGKSLMLYSYS